MAVSEDTTAQAHGLNTATQALDLHVLFRAIARIGQEFMSSDREAIPAATEEMMLIATQGGGR